MQVSALELARLPHLYGSNHVPCVVYLHQIGWSVICIASEGKHIPCVLAATPAVLKEFRYMKSLWLWMIPVNAAECKVFFSFFSLPVLDNPIGELYI